MSLPVRRATTWDRRDHRALAITQPESHQGARATRNTGHRPARREVRPGSGGVGLRVRGRRRPFVPARRMRCPVRYFVEERSVPKVPPSSAYAARLRSLHTSSVGIVSGQIGEQGHSFHEVGHHSSVVRHPPVPDDALPQAPRSRRRGSPPGGQPSLPSPFPCSAPARRCCDVPIVGYVPRIRRGTPLLWLRPARELEGSEH